MSNMRLISWIRPHGSETLNIAIIKFKKIVILLIWAMQKLIFLNLTRAQKCCEKNKRTKTKA
jgi:hypothetical protein